MTGVLLLSLFQRWLGAHQAADYIPPFSLLIASSLTDNGRLRTPSKCSAHLFKISRFLAGFLYHSHQTSIGVCEILVLWESIAEE